MSDHRCPEGVSLHDEATDTLRDDRHWIVLDDGREPVLRLRVARGTVSDDVTSTDLEHQEYAV